jgi:outer membrane lipoprotein SlyB
MPPFTRDNLRFVFASAFLAMGGSACNSGSSGLPVYDRGQVGQVVSAQRGEVLAVRDVIIKGQANQMGSTGSGARIGSAAVTGAIFGAPERAVASVVGSIAGSAAGAKFDDKLGEEITVMLEEGKTVVIVQERATGVQPLAPGERVLLQTGSSSGYGSGNSRVIRDEQQYSDVIGAR